MRTITANIGSFTDYRLLESRRLSLTSLLDANRDVREYLQLAFRKPRIQPAPALLVHPRTKNYGLVGAAFDYLARLQAKRRNAFAIERGPWVAESAISRLPRPVRGIGKAATLRARELSDRCVVDGVVTPDLLSVFINLAQLDTSFGPAASLS